MQIVYMFIIYVSEHKSEQKLVIRTQVVLAKCKKCGYDWFLQLHPCVK